MCFNSAPKPAALPAPPPLPTPQAPPPPPPKPAPAPKPVEAPETATLAIGSQRRTSSSKKRGAGELRSGARPSVNTTLGGVNL